MLRNRRPSTVDKIEATLDAVEPAIEIIEPLLNGGIIQLDAADLALERAEPRHDFVELAVDAVETIVELCETSAQKSRTSPTSLMAALRPFRRASCQATRLACQGPGPNWLRLTMPWFWSLAAPSMAVPLMLPSRISPSKK